MLSAAHSGRGWLHGRVTCRQLSSLFPVLTQLRRFSGVSFSPELQDVFRDFPEFDTLSVGLQISPRPNPPSSPDDPIPSTRPPAAAEPAPSIPPPLCGVPVLEELFRRNVDNPKQQNSQLMRILTHETVLYRGVMERRRRVRRLAKFMSNRLRLEKDDVNLRWILDLGKLLRQVDFSFAPEQYQTFPLPSGKSIRLAVPSSRDEIILDSVRLVLDAVYEPRFSEFSFGFRPGRGRQVALRNIRNHIRGMDYYIVLDLSEALQQLRGFEMVNAACKHLHDPLLVRLLYKALDVGYVNTFGLQAESFVSVPREMGISPVLLNCFLDSFDQWMEIYRIRYSDCGRSAKWPISDEFSSPGYRQLRFCRHGAAVFLGLRGNKAEAYGVAGDVRFKLAQMGVDPTVSKLHVAHAFDHKDASQRAFFLGYEISREKLPSDMPASLAQTARFQTRLLFFIPTIELRDCFLDNGFIKMSKRRTWIPLGNGYITHWPVEHLVRYFDRLTVGLIEYYALADNFRQLNWFVYILKRSCALTVGRKLGLRSMRKVFSKYGRDLAVKDGERIVATLPDRSLAVRPLVKDFFPELTPYLRRRRFITRGVRQNILPEDDDAQP